ncbi:MAG: 16S rRNA (guanine(966)-N(2))-methyltransferase RsmD [Synechococcus sp. SB0668_bin_15]|nr:16S rRNA (guanine(966)-N(2))-methyltransferase RsmD [Synechococcus sp. SB0668_bin_15]MXZ83802.1 16S rRNA (guanine(966)-N(2))-methyltransferase RsmD [Synechococcus sp. SB0666_bin_14]MYA91608.1 16S rRNA (guanine(966)-N(2))-methyltransferase RsmD [Synechococcus sp. SB0663_bin_10]MYC50523.1 16S rRNA (guanine(966)-N(2))-methyltransferase RsmD [Synechococcus sp. SB0662_bin_14]MYG47169.1 16S rRNA (guanine(966)-N(2))-methyltransferase RsmD [Synechococcus sp. SB0675_bin_6]MYJ59203.1 16S rRNA (guanin
MPHGGGHGGLRLSDGRRLQSPPGAVTRPTPGRVRQSVFDLLREQVEGARWLDLFSGSGAMACEALLHGAAHVTAVERHGRVAAVTRHNLELVCRPPQTFALHRREVLAWLRAWNRATEPQQPFALIYADPPYNGGLHEPVAMAVAASGVMAPTGLLLLECTSRQPPATLPGWQLGSRHCYGGTTVLLLRQATGAT